MKRMVSFLFVFWIISLPLLGFASEITLFDKQAGASDGKTKAWWINPNEDQEVEPGAAQGQKWDLEGMFFNGTSLSILGGWDFKNTIYDSPSNSYIGSGDIFISTQNPVRYGSDTSNASTDTDITNSFGYNYVFDVNWENFTQISDDNPTKWQGSYTLLQIDKDTMVSTSTAFGKSNPVSYVSDAVNSVHATGTFEYESRLSDADTGFTGGSHYKISGFDLTQIDGFNGNFTAHFTQDCGNDTIMGQVPEPATMLLLGMGLLGIGAIGRKLPI